MKVAVTGASGFIGQYVIRELARFDGLEVIAAARCTMDASRLPRSTRCVQLDIEDEATSSAAYELLGYPHVLIHLAWAGLPNYKALYHFEGHLARQYRFLSGLVREGLPSLTCAGTCFEYGMRFGPLREDMSTDPQNAYGFAKDALRRQLSFLRDHKRFEFTWARLFYTYGEGQPAGSLFSQFTSAVQRGDRTFRMSGGEQLRDFLPVDTMARIIVALAINAAGAGVVNVCSGKPISVRSLVESWRAERDSDIELEVGHFPYPDFEPMAFWGCDARLRELLHRQTLVDSR